jgi:cytochrome c oxidase subunit 4
MTRLCGMGHGALPREMDVKGTSTDVARPHSARLYVAVWAALVTLTAFTVGAASLDLKHLSTLTAVAIAVVKASLVLLYFMHLRYERPLFRYMVLAALVTFGIFFGLMFLDYGFR